MAYADFRQRCASALTHPVTIAAVAALLANDLVFKLLWPEHWVTGKLSDFMWVVFAPPLLVLLLSFLTFRKPWAERTMFAAAYAVLPLTYVAFNSSEAVHRWVMWALLPLTGSATGSPFDPTDSLVVLPGLALALWVWKRAPARPDGTRMRLHMFAAVAMILATVATSPLPTTSQTAWLVGINDLGTIVVEGSRGEYYGSGDGGVTWSEITRGQRRRVGWGGQEATTPRGTYAIQGSDILLRDSSGQSAIVYRRSEAELWAQQYASRRLSRDVSESYRNPETLSEQKLFGIVYDGRTANVIVGAGWEGVLVGKPDGTWERTAVGQFAPTDLSFPSKVGLMLSFHFWPTVLAVSLSIIALASVCLEVTLTWNSRVRIRRILVAVLLASAGIFLATIAFPPYADQSSPEDLLAVFALLPAGSAAWVMFPSNGRELPAYAAALFAMLALAPLSFLLWLADRVTLVVAWLGALVLLALVAWALYRYLLKRRRAADGVQ